MQVPIQIEDYVCEEDIESEHEDGDDSDDELIEDDN